MFFGKSEEKKNQQLHSSEAGRSFHPWGGAETKHHLFGLSHSRLPNNCQAVGLPLYFRHFANIRLPSSIYALVCAEEIFLVWALLAAETSKTSKSEMHLRLRYLFLKTGNDGYGEEE